MLRATIDEPVPLQVQAADGRTDLFARARVYETGNSTPISTVALPHIAGGLYGSTITFTIDGYFTSQYQLFTDAGFTAEAKYDIEVEVIEANSDKTNILRLLGLTHHNSVLEPLVYNAEGCMTDAQVRAYDSEANAQLDDGSTGLLFSWTIKVTYTGGQMTNYLVTLD